MVKPTAKKTVLFLYVIPIIIFGQFTECQASHQKKYVISGKTMGTYYSVTVLGKKAIDQALLETTINQRLQMINQSMSIFSGNSEISRFNRLTAGECMTISDDFCQVLSVGQRLFELTRGAWDGTVKPLVDLWGFGIRPGITEIPDPETIKACLENIGFNHILISDKSIQKDISNVALDLCSIAKGYGVDAVARHLKASGYNSFIVEIGGEIIASGKKESGEPWTVGISKPDNNFSSQSLHKIVRLDEKAMATSGTYRNYITIDHKSYSHIINPVTGYPETNGVVSASVIADSCTVADGLATALMVMGAQKGIEMINHLENTECLIIVREKNGTLTDWSSDSFNDYLLH